MKELFIKGLKTTTIKDKNEKHLHFLHTLPNFSRGVDSVWPSYHLRANRCRLKWMAPTI